jgi:hypothetical protein
VTIQRAFTFVFDDPKWVEKAVMLAIITAAAGLLTPPLIGLVGWAILFGYQLELIRNVRDGVKYPLPKWDNFGELVVNGGGVLLAYFVYNIPNLFISAFTFFVTGLAGDTSIVSGGVSFAISCCLFPFVLVYNLITQPMCAIAISRYADSLQVMDFFRFGDLFSTLRENFNAVVQWWIGISIALVALIIAVIIPCFGWIAALILVIPVTGALAGMLAAQIGKEKAKPKRQ